MQQIKCENCGKTFHENLQSCPHCKFQYEYKSICSYCDNKSVGKYFFCPSCRKPLFSNIRFYFYLVVELLISIFCLIGHFFIKDNKPLEIPFMSFYIIAWLILSMGPICVIIRQIDCQRLKKIKLQKKRAEWDSRTPERSKNSSAYKTR